MELPFCLFPVKTQRLIEIATAIGSGHFTFALKNGKIISIGQNNPRKTHPRNLLRPYLDRDGNNISNQVGVHSELRCILNMGLDDCRGHSFFNVRIDNNGRIGNSRPCAGCQHLLRSVGFKRVFFSNSAGQFEVFG